MNTVINCCRIVISRYDIVTMLLADACRCLKCQLSRGDSSSMGVYGLCNKVLMLDTHKQHSVYVNDRSLRLA